MSQYKIENPLEQYASFTGQNLNIKLLLQIGLYRNLYKDEDKMVSQFFEKFSDLVMHNNRRDNPKIVKMFKEEREKIIGLFPMPIFIKEIPNEYDNDPLRPWFLITTPKGPIKIGWRNRVIEINWNESVIEYPAAALFPDEDVTKMGKIIHAWGYDKAYEYLNHILNDQNGAD